MQPLIESELLGENPESLVDYLNDLQRGFFLS